MAALISSVMNTKDRVPLYVNACRELGIDVLPPDVNFSQADFAVVEGKIRFGLNAVKNVGGPAAEAILRARTEGGPFASIWDFTERADPQRVNKRALESLVKCGALDSVGSTRLGMLAVLDQALAYGSKQAQDRLAGQASIFDDDLGSAEMVERRTIRRSQPGVRRAGAAPAREGDARAVRLGAPARAGARRAQAKDGLHAVGGRTAPGRRDRARGGIVSGLKQVTTKRGDPMVFATLDDLREAPRSSSSTRPTPPHATTSSPIACSSSRDVSTTSRRGRQRSSRSR